MFSLLTRQGSVSGIRSLPLILAQPSVATGTSFNGCGHTTQRQSHHRWYEGYLRDMWNRRQLIGPDEPIPRSHLPNWNTNAELFAFGKRLGENFQADTLKGIFDWPKDEDGLIPEPSAYSTFVERGGEILTEYVKAYLRIHFPNLPEEGILAINDFLTSVSVISHVGKHLGIQDLIETSRFPARDEDIANSFKAILAGLETDTGSIERSESIIQDLVMSQLIGVDINDVFLVKNPMGVLHQILKGMNRSPPESRLLRSSGEMTVTPVYVVGIYSDQELLGECAGETTEIAEEMAARDCLRTLWGTTDDREPLTFGRPIDPEVLNHFKNESNGFLNLMCEDNDRKTGDYEPLNYEDMMDFYKETLEPKLGVPYRRRLKHKWFYGTRFKKLTRKVSKPYPESI